jgi:hypothetical protein
MPLNELLSGHIEGEIDISPCGRHVRCRDEWFGQTQCGMKSSIHETTFCANGALREVTTAEAGDLEGQPTSA